MRNFTFLREKERQYSLIEINRIGYYTIEEMIHLLKDEFIGVNIKEKMDIVGQDSVIIKDNDIVSYLDQQYKNSLTGMFNDCTRDLFFGELPTTTIPNIVNICRNVELVLENNDEGEMIPIDENSYEILLNETNDDMIGGEVMVHQSNGVDIFVGLNIDGGYYFERFRGINRYV
jgi:hypothetical protein